MSWLKESLGNGWPSVRSKKIKIESTCKAESAGIFLLPAIQLTEWPHISCIKMKGMGQFQPDLEASRG
jgi:hypothetical protein